ncbi:MAG: Rho termination factor N-terminal domain-containing protein [Thermoleophilaceae bacterium]|nr:Rho termination factor N-terminal domain-containing protein [Thermoleophilaceae bacterium]
MSAVLDIDNLLESPLADLHALAGELDIEGYRLLKKSDLTIAILESRGAIGDEIRPAVEAKAQELAAIKAERERELAAKEAAEEEAREEAREAAEAQRAQKPRNQRGDRGGRSSERGGRNRRGGRGGERKGQAGEGRTPRERGAQAEGKRAAEKPESKSEAKPRANEPTTPLAGVFEPGSGGGGRLRTDLTRRVRGDADVPRGEVRRWNLQRGDLLQAQVKKARRGRTDFVVASLESVNGLDQAARKQAGPAFEKRDAAPIAGAYAKRTFKHAPVGDGSRLVITGPTRAAASEMLKKLAGELAGDNVVTTLVIVSARPEQSEVINGVEVIAGDATKAPEDVLPALELALERDKRLAESGRATALLVDGLDLLPSEKAAEIFNSARNLAQGGALTIAAAGGAGSPLEALASSIGVVAGGRKLKLDKKSSWTASK